MSGIQPVALNKITNKAIMFRGQEENVVAKAGTVQSSPAADEFKKEGAEESSKKDNSLRNMIIGGLVIAGAAVAGYLTHKHFKWGEFNGVIKDVEAKLGKEANALDRYNAFNEALGKHVESGKNKKTAEQLRALLKERESNGLKEFSAKCKSEVEELSKVENKTAEQVEQMNKLEKQIKEVDDIIAPNKVEAGAAANAAGEAGDAAGEASGEAAEGAEG